MTNMWLAKYALHNGKIPKIEDAQMDEKHVYREEPFIIGKDVFPSYGEALAAAEALRTQKIAALEQQIEKLRSLEFREVVVPPPASEPPEATDA